jgi:hypothetical protein
MACDAGTRKSAATTIAINVIVLLKLLFLPSVKHPLDADMHRNLK